MITTALCNSYKQEALQGIHQAADTYKVALFTSAATLDKTTTAYAATNETSGAGYTAGGQNLAGFSSGLSGDTAYIDFLTNPSWPGATFTARGALIYNSTRSNKAVAVIDFGGDVSVAAGTFTLNMPAAGSSSLITIT